MDKRKLENILDELQIKINTFGYKYWITAVELYLKDNTVGITELYKMIAKIHNTTASRTERALRDSYKNSKELIREYFCIDYGIDNSVFLALLAREMERLEC